jgi:hypothetical protein
MPDRLRTLLSRLAAGPPIVEALTESYWAWRESRQWTPRTALRFSIRDLLWLMLVVALGAAWWAEHRRADRAVKHDSGMHSENARLRREVAKLSLPLDTDKPTP